MAALPHCRSLDRGGPRGPSLSRARRPVRLAVQLGILSKPSQARFSKVLSGGSQQRPARPAAGRRSRRPELGQGQAVPAEAPRREQVDAGHRDSTCGTSLPTSRTPPPPESSDAICAPELRPAGHGAGVDPRRRRARPTNRVTLIRACPPFAETCAGEAIQQAPSACGDSSGLDAGDFRCDSPRRRSPLRPVNLEISSGGDQAPAQEVQSRCESR